MKGSTGWSLFYLCFSVWCRLFYYFCDIIDDKICDKMNKMQKNIADEMLCYIHKNNCRIESSNLSDYMDEKFGFQSGIDIEYVKATLMNDYHLIEPLGKAWIRITATGEHVVWVGFDAYLDELKGKDKQDEEVKRTTIKANKMIWPTVIATMVATIIASIIARV